MSHIFILIWVASVHVWIHFTDSKTVGFKSNNGVKCVDGNTRISHYQDGIEVEYNYSRCKPERFPPRIKIGVYQLIPFCKYNELQDGEIVSASGYVPDLIEILAQHINFTYSLHPMTAYGKQLESGNWTGGVNGLITKQIDIFAADFTTTSSRRKVIDFGPPYAYDNYRVFLLKKPQSSETDFNWMVYWKPINWKCYIVLLIFIFTLTLCLNASYKFERQIAAANIGNYYKKNVAVIFFKVWAVIVSQGTTFELNFYSSKIFTVTLSIMAMFICQCFNSVLMSHMTVTADYEIKTIDDMLKIPDLKIGWHSNSILQQELKNSTIPHELEFWNRVQRFKTGNVDSWDEIDRFLDGNSAYLYSKYEFEATNGTNNMCNFYTLKNYFPFSYHFGLQKGSKLNQQLTAATLKMRETGILKKIHGQYKKARYCGQDKAWRENINGVGINAAIGLFAPLLVGISLSLISYIIEVVYWYRIHLEILHNLTS